MRTLPPCSLFVDIRFAARGMQQYRTFEKCIDRSSVVQRTCWSVADRVNVQEHTKKRGNLPFSIHKGTSAGLVVSPVSCLARGLVEFSGRTQAQVNGLVEVRKKPWGFTVRSRGSIKACGKLWRLVYDTVWIVIFIDFRLFTWLFTVRIHPFSFWVVFS